MDVIKVDTCIIPVQRLRQMSRKHLKILLLFCVCLSIYVYTYIHQNYLDRKEEQDRERYAKRKRNLLAASARLLNVDNDKLDKLTNRSPADDINTSSKLQHQPIITLFTSWTASESEYARRNTTVENWNRLKPYVIPLLFTNDDALRSTVEKKGWKTLPVTKYGINIPVLKDMYFGAMRNFKTRFYAYANGDILFTDNLLVTLLGILRNVDVMNRTMLIIGRRTNVKNITKQEAISFAMLRNTMTTRGDLFNHWAVDYFITTTSFPWKEMPNVVIGRRGFDNFLVLESLKRSFYVIDATETVLAIHHTTDAGNYEHLSKGNGDYNTNLISKYYQNKTVDYSKGMTKCANFYSDTLTNGTVVVRKKEKRPC